MSRRKDQTLKPEPAAEPISLLRLEERIERVPLTDEQARERMSIAAAKFASASRVDAEVRDLKDALKEKVARADSLRAEGTAIVLDAETGTTAAPYPVIVERHPTRPSEMIVWRVPDGMNGADLLAAELPEGEAWIAAREAQGCVLVESRAMAADELEVARAADEARRNPTLPFPDGALTPPASTEGEAPAGAPDGDEAFLDAMAAAATPAAVAPEDGVILEQLERYLGVVCPECAALVGDLCVDNGRQTDDVHGARIIASQSPHESPAADAQPPADEGAPDEDDEDDAPKTNGGRRASPDPLCPAVLGKARDPLDDLLCGNKGSRRARGLCPVHKSASGDLVTEWTARRDMRRTAQRQAERVAALAAAEQAAEA